MRDYFEKVAKEPTSARPELEHVDEIVLQLYDLVGPPKDDLLRLFQGHQRVGVPFEYIVGEESDVMELVRSVIPNPQTWLDSPNAQLDGRKPRELIGTSHEQLVRDLLRAIKYGIVS